MIVQRLLIAAALAFAAALPYLGWLPGWTPALATVAAFGTVSLIGLNLIYGVTGMLALGQAAFVAIPGYASGIMEKFGVSAFVSIPLGVVFAALVARLVAEIFIRLPGIYFAIGTLGFAFVVEGLARAFPSVTGGASGLVLEPPFPLRRDGWYMVALVALAVGIASFAWLVRGRFLRTLKLVRHDELAAQVMGVDVVRVKANVFTIGSAYSAVGGVLLAYYVAVLAPEAGGVNASLEFACHARHRRQRFAVRPAPRGRCHPVAVRNLGTSGPLRTAGLRARLLLRRSVRAVRDRRRVARGMEARDRQPCAQNPSQSRLDGLRRTEDHGYRGAACRHLPAGRECREKFWRFARRSGREFRRQFRSDRCIDRTQRSGEIDPIQHHFRHRNSDTGTSRASG